MTEAVLLNSGGIDSRVAAAIMTGEDYGWQLHSLHIPFNPHNRKACKGAAKRTAEMYCVDHEVSRRPDDWMMHMHERGFKHLPHTGIYTHLLAAIYAHSHEIPYVVSGIRKDVMQEDWRGKFIDLLSMSKLTKPAVIVMPLLEETAADAGVRLAMELDVDISDTHSCWTDPACGTCHKCSTRDGSTSNLGRAWVHLQRQGEQAAGRPDGDVSLRAGGP